MTYNIKHAISNTVYTASIITKTVNTTLAAKTLRISYLLGNAALYTARVSFLLTKRDKIQDKESRAYTDLSSDIQQHTDRAGYFLHLARKEGFLLGTTNPTSLQQQTLLDIYKTAQKIKQANTQCKLTLDVVYCSAAYSVLENHSNLITHNVNESAKLPPNFFIPEDMQDDVLDAFSSYTSHPPVPPVQDSHKKED